MYFGIDEPQIAKLAKAYIVEGDIVYDIGAHIGYTALLFRQRVGSTSSVHAFEILPSTAEMLRKTVQSNGFDNIIIHNVGLGADSQILELPILVSEMTSIFSRSHESHRKMLCRIEPLDLYVKENNLPDPHFIKIDVEGAENYVLRGAYEIINRCRPVMVVEFHNIDLLREGYLLLCSWGYRLVTCKGVTIDSEYLEKLNKFHQSVLCIP
jgi:FkbM family methyltransferase